MSNERLVVVEDESDIAEVLHYNLTKEGFDVEVHSRGDAALEAIRANPPSLVLLDLMLPGMDGLEIMRMLRRESATSTLPVIMITAKGEDVDRIVGLELGADDYITKPFSPREVVLRVKGLLRRRETKTGEDDEILETGAIRLDIAGHRLEIAGVETPVTATEFRLLRELMANAGRVQTRDRLLTVVWGYAQEVDSRTVDTHVRRLRKKLGDEAGRIETVVGVGYRLGK